MRYFKSEGLHATKRCLDIYDPTTCEIRNSSTDDIACWLIDSEFNSESLFVRRACFTGANELYDKLKRVLRADSRIPKPASGKIAVKAINHNGDEVLEVLSVEEHVTYVNSPC